MRRAASIIIGTVPVDEKIGGAVNVQVRNHVAAASRANGYIFSLNVC